MTIWDVFEKLVSRLLLIQDSQYPTILTKLETIMSKSDTILTDITEANVSISNLSGDVNALLAIHTKDTEAIAALEAVCC